jgi:formate dehydrogenase
VAAQRVDRAIVHHAEDPGAHAAPRAVIAGAAAPQREKRLLHHFFGQAASSAHAVRERESRAGVTVEHDLERPCLPIAHERHEVLIGEVAQVGLPRETVRSEHCLDSYAQNRLPDHRAGARSSLRCAASARHRASALPRTRLMLIIAWPHTPCAARRRDGRGSPQANEEEAMANVLCVLYEDPVDGYPPAYARDEIPKIERYYDGQTTPTPERIDFTPGELLGCVSGELGLREFLEQRGHRLIVTSDKDGSDSVFERELPDADVVISQPFWPAYLTSERIAKAPNLRLAVTAGIGSDHVDLQAAMEHGLTVAEVTYCNSISVAEHVVMMILALVRNYLPSYKWVLDGGWNIADCVSRSYDLEGMQVGTVAAGRIGSAVLRRLKPFEVGLHYTDRHRLPAEVEQELGVTFHETPESLVEVCDVVTINAPLHPETEHLFDERLIGRMKRGAYLINTARGKICDREAVARACESGQLAGYAGDVWFPQPAPRDHPWRSMPHHGMTPHTSGTSLSAQTRYAAGVREILECWLDERPIREEYLIVDGGQLAGAGAHSYSPGDATGGSEEAARFARG